MTEIIEAFGQAIVTFITYPIQAIVEGVDTLLYTGSGETRELTTVAKLGFTMIGCGLAVGLGRLIFRLVTKAKPGKA